MDKINEIHKVIHTFLKERDWEKFHKPKNLAMSISIEAAELMELFQWISVKTSLERIDDEEFLKKVKDEVADILIYTFSFARVAGLDIYEIILEKMKRNEKRFPKDKSYFY